jgi:general secretion pathway protein J
MSDADRSAYVAGFTLVEMLVALFIFGLLSAAGVAVMAYAADNRGVVHERMERLGEFQRARALLRADLGQAAVRRVRHGDGQSARRAFIDGRPGDTGPLLGLVRRGWSNPDADPRASLQYIEYRLADGRLERSSRPMLDGAAAGTPQVLLTGVRSASLRYRYRGAWISGWPGGAEALPEAIAMDLELDRIGHVSQVFLLPGGRQ